MLFNCCNYYKYIADISSVDNCPPNKDYLAKKSDIALYTPLTSEGSPSTFLNKSLIISNVVVSFPDFLPESEELPAPNKLEISVVD